MGPSASSDAGSGAFLVDLVLYVSLMFLIREVYFPSVGFIFNGLFWSLTTLACATWRMRARGITWADLGLCKPKNIQTTVIAVLFIFGLTIGFIVVFQIINEQLQSGIAPDTSNESAVHKFGNLKNINELLTFLEIHDPEEYRKRMIYLENYKSRELKNR